jgi:hypothetical protein
LRKIRQYREEGRTIYYLDETWLNAGHTTSKCWTDQSVKSAKDAFLRGLSPGLKNPCGKGGRLIILHIGNEFGFVDNGAFIFQANKTADYHDEMTATVFTDWFRSILPELDPGCVIVMDNAPYHSHKSEKIPNQSSKKSEIVDWLASKGVSYEPDSLKAELLMKVNEIRVQFESYVIDTLAESTGRKVLRLPPYHCELNPIELIWADIKGYVARENREFKLPLTKDLLAVGIARVTPEKWKKCVDHVKDKVETNFWNLDGLMETAVEPVIITLENDDDSDDDFDALFGDP